MIEQVAQIPLAITGMACRLPGANNLDEFWQLLDHGVSAAREVPPERLDPSLYYSPERGVRGKSYAKMAALVDYRPFDARICPVPTHSLPSADVGQLTICQVAAEACRHAGMDPFALPIRNAGVYIGHTVGGRLGADLTYSTCVGEAAEYLRELPQFRELAGDQAGAIIAEVVRGIRRRLPRRGRDGMPGVTAHLAATMISEALGLNGPAMVLDAACASSLQGLALAARALRQGHIEMAIVGGASYCSSDTLVLFSQAQSVTAGQSRPFDAEADGLLAGEGYVALVVKTLPRALADGDPVRGVIRGIGVASDGRGKSLWAPRKEGQIAAIQRAYAGKLDMSRLQYVEAHATSTQAGDTVEMTALAAALDGHLLPGTKIPVGSVKANIGHTLETAGLAGLLKTLLCIQHATVPRQINCRRLNPSIDWRHVPYFVPMENLPWPAWPDGHPRRAAVNAFGIGGLNVHVVVDEFLPGEPSPFSPGGLSPFSPRGLSPFSPGGLSPFSPEKSLEAPDTATAKMGTVPLATLTDNTSPSPRPYPGHPGAPAPRVGGSWRGGSSDIAVIGMGCTFAGARDLDAYWDLLASGRDPKCEVPPERWNRRLSYDPAAPQPWRSVTKLGGFVTDFVYDWRRHKVPPKQIAGADPLQFMVLDATDAALRDAGYDARPYDKTRVAAIVGTIFGGDFANQLQMGIRLPEFQRTLADVLHGRGVESQQAQAVGDAYAELLLQRMPALVDETGSFTPSSLASRLTKSFDLMGGAATINAGQCSSLAALGAAVDMLRSGECDMVVCAAGGRGMGLPGYERGSLAGLLTENPKAPFDAEAHGFVPGEGVAVLLLKRLADARRDGDRVHAVVRGVGSGFGKTRADGLRLAIGRALESCPAAAEDLTVVEAAGVGVRPQDEQELQALLETYGSKPRPRPLWLDSVAAQLGDVRGVAGMASLIKATLATEHGRLPRTFGLTQAADWVAAHAERLKTVAEDVPLATSKPGGAILAGVNSCEGAQAALAYHVIIEGGAGVLSPAAPSPCEETAAGQDASATMDEDAPSCSVSAVREETFSDWRIVRIGGSDPREVASRAAAAAGDAASCFAATPAAFTPADRYRLAIVAGAAADLAEKARLAADILTEPKSRQRLEQKGIFFRRAAAERPRVAFMFPGQGSQYPGMLQDLIREFPPAAEAMRQNDDALAALGFPPFAELAWSQAEPLGNDVWRTQLAVLAADAILNASLRALGIVPDRLSGHSYGEYPALVAARAWTFESAALATRARSRAIEQSRSAGGALVSAAVEAPRLEQLCRETGGRLYLANHNGPRQTVAGGDEEAIARLAQRLRAEGIIVQRLPVPRPYHTPLMEETKALLAPALGEIRLRPPRTPLLSSVTNRYVAEPAEIRANLVVQMTEPVRYVELVERLIREKVSVLIEAGPGQVLTGLHRQIIGDREVSAIAADDRRRGGIQPLLRVQACLEAMGALGPAAGDCPDVRASTGQRGADAAGVGTKMGLSPSRDTEIGTAPAAGPSNLLVLGLRGTPYEMGLAHGRAQQPQIRTILRCYADIAGFAGDLLPGPAFTPSQWETLFGAEGLEELRGIADGAGVSLPSIVSHNLRLFPQGAGCVHFVLSAAANPAAGLVHAANEDLPLALTVRGCLERNIQARAPAGRIPHVAFAVAGQPGGCTGVNAQGLAVTSATLLDQPAVSAARGRLHGMIIARILEAAADLDAAIEIARQTPSQGAWGLCLSHHPTDRTCYLEHDGKTLRVQQAPVMLAANHSLLRPAAEAVPAHSLHRLARLRELLGGDDAEVDLPRARAALRDRFDVARGRVTPHPTMNTIRRIDNQVSIVMQPAGGDAWVTGGPGSPGAEDVFRHIKLGDLLHEPRAQDAAQPAAVPIQLSSNESCEATPRASERVPRPQHETGVRGPLLDEIVELLPGRRLTAELHLDPCRDRFLREHRFKGKPMLPLVVALEAFAEAAALLGEGTAPGGLRSVEAGDALRFFSEQPINARLDAERTEEGVACRLTSDLRDRQGRLVQAGRMHLSGAVELGPWNGAADLTAPWVPPTWTWNAVDYPDESAVIHHGPAFRCLRQVMVSEGGGWGKLMAPAPGELAMERGAESLLLPAAVLDASFFACGVAVWLDGGAVAIPHGLQRLRWGRLPRAGEECMLRLVRLRAPDQRAAFDFALFGEDGAAIAQVQRYEAVLVKG